MKKKTGTVWIAFLAALIVAAGMTGCTNGPPPVMSDSSVAISSPSVGDEPMAGDITVEINTSNFDLVQKLGEDTVAGEGHVHYYMDADVPTTPGEPAVTEAGTYAVTTSTSYTWKLVSPGEHTFSAQLVNNDHTPLDPPAFDSVTITVVPKQYNLVAGWYRGRQVEYYDFGAATPLVNGMVATAPIYAFITGMDSEGNPQFVEGQHNIIDVIPGDEGYSDLWRVNLVTIPESYSADTIKSASDLMDTTYTITQTDLLVNCPVVPEGSIAESGIGLTQGWYQGNAVYYYDFGQNPDIDAPIYVPITGMDAQGNPQFVDGQMNIIDVVPGDEGYSDFWRVNLVNVPEDYEANTFRSADDVMASGYEMTETDMLVNCPVVNVEEAAVTTMIEITASNIAFNTDMITVPAGAMVMIEFNNMDTVPHNFALYQTEAATQAIFVGDVITGPVTTTYEFTAPSTPGTYYFRCDVHPAAMTGDFIVQ